MIDRILEEDRSLPRKQRHTAKRIYDRLRASHRFGGKYTMVKDQQDYSPSGSLLYMASRECKPIQTCKAWQGCLKWKLVPVPCVFDKYKK